MLCTFPLSVAHPLLLFILFFVFLDYKKIVKIDNIIDNVEPEECRRLINEHLPETAADNQMMKTVYLK